jgi:hypothetical protein
VSGAPGRAIPLPYAFDARIGYWTGEIDWDLLASALPVVADLTGVPPATEPAEWLAAARVGRAAPLAWSGLTLVVEGDTLLIRGEEGLVEPVALGIERHLAHSPG